MPLITLNIDYLLHELDSSFYTMPLMLVLSVLFLAVAIWNRAVQKMFLIEHVTAILLMLLDKINMQLLPAG